MILSAELPNPQEDPELFEIVKKNMIHGPYNMNSPCMIDGKRSKKFPKLYTTETKTGDDGYPQYRRRSPETGGATVQVSMSGGRTYT